MKKVILSNGLTVIYEKKKSAAVVIELMIKIGSNQEKKEERGIAHFLEHMLFEGTKSRPSNLEISNEIEKIGGSFNAYTTNERTCFYVKVLKKHFQKAVDILADILQNSLFKEEHFLKEKQIILKEIDIINDNPKNYQWLLLQKILFENQPAGFPAYGDKKIIRNLTKEKMICFFNKYYVPNNIVISIVGEVPNWKKETKKKFLMKEKKPVSKYKMQSVPNKEKKNNKTKIEKKNIMNTYVVFGFKTAPRNHPDSYVLEVINAVLGKGQSGKIFTRIRSKKGLAYDVGTQHVSEISFGFFAVYATIDKKKIKITKTLVLDEIQKLKNITSQDLQEAKDFIEGDYLLELDDTQKVANQLLFWEQVGNAQMMKEFLPKIKRVSRADIKRVINKYFKNYSLVILKGK